jgi:hypothetical protein
MIERVYKKKIVRKSRGNENTAATMKATKQLSARQKRREAGKRFLAFAEELASQGYDLVPPLTRDEIYDR